MDDYQLDKPVWTDADFDVMGWHDSLIYAVKVEQDLYLDIDYIFKWVQPTEDRWLSFWVAPCTLVFPTPTRFRFDLRSNDLYDYIEIADLHKQRHQNGKTEWRVETHIGDIMVEAETFKQFVRRRPTHQTGQQVIKEERGEVSFATSFDKDFIETAEVKQIKQEVFALRQKATAARLLQKELSELHGMRLEGAIDAKQYIIRKRELEQQFQTIQKEIDLSGFGHLTNSNF